MLKNTCMVISGCLRDVVISLFLPWRVILRGEEFLFVLTFVICRLGCVSSLIGREFFPGLPESCDVFSEVSFLLWGEVCVGVAASAVTGAVPPDVSVVTQELSIHPY